MPDTRLVLAFEAIDLTELYTIRLALEAADIPFHVEGELIGGSAGLSSMSSSIVRVPANRLTEAREVVRDFEEVS